MPSGLAEVELFTFWEADLAADLPPDLPPDLAVVQPVEDRAPVDRPPRGADDAPSTAPLCWALGSVLAFLLVALLL
jgi:hypothetical protein